MEPASTARVRDRSDFLMHTRSRSAVRACIIAAGGSMIGFAALFSNAAIERALTGELGSLAWGPPLFRGLLAIHGLALSLVGFFGLRRVVIAGMTGTVPGSHDKGRRGGWLILAGLTALALGLRLWRLESCLWFDEVLTLVDFVRPPIGVVATTFTNQNQHMLYSILAHGSIAAFGEKAWALRLPAVMFGIASIWALFLLARRIVGTTAALLACALMTASYHHIWFSQNARGYTGLLFFTLLATWLWRDAILRPRWTTWLAYAVTCSLGLWVHLSMVFVLAAHGLLLTADWARQLLSRNIRNSQRSNFQKPVVAGLLCGTLTLQVYALSLPEFLRSALHEGGGLPSEWTSPIWALKESFRSLQVGLSGSLLVLTGVALALVGWISILRRDWRAGWAMVLPGLLGGGAMLVLGHNLWPRFFFFLMGFALIIVVHGATEFPRLLLAPLAGMQSRNRTAATAAKLGYALASMMVFVSALTVPRCYAFPKQDFTGARDYVERNRGREDSVVAAGLAGTAYSRYFAPDWQVVRNAEELRAVQDGNATVWLVYTIPVQLKSFEAPLWQAIEEDFEIVKVFPGTLSGGDMTICRTRPLQ